MSNYKLLRCDRTEWRAGEKFLDKVDKVNKVGRLVERLLTFQWHISMFTNGTTSGEQLWLKPRTQTCKSDVRFGPNMGQIGPKLDKSWALSDQISVYFGSSRYHSSKLLEPKCTENRSERVPNWPIWCQSDPLWGQIWHTWAARFLFSVYRH